MLSSETERQIRREWERRAEAWDFPSEDSVECTECGETYDQRRAALGYSTCLDCGDAAAASERASWCIAPAGHKQGETLVRDPTHLKQINKYAAG